MVLKIDATGSKYAAGLKSTAVAFFVACAAFFGAFNVVNGDINNPPPHIGTSLNSVIASSTWLSNGFINWFVESQNCNIGLSTRSQKAFYNENTQLWEVAAQTASQTCPNQNQSAYPGKIPFGIATNNGLTNTLGTDFTQGAGWYAGFFALDGLPFTSLTATSAFSVIAYYDGVSTSTLYVPDAPVPPPPPPITSTQGNRSIIIYNPTYATVTPNTTVFVSIDFKSQAGFDFLTLPPQTYGYEIFDAVSNTLLFTDSNSIATNTNFALNYSSTTIQTSGSKILRAFIRDTNTGINLLPPAEVFYSVETNTYLLATGLNSPQDAAGDLTQNDCATFDVGCQFQRALVFLFIPNSSLDRFLALWQQLILIPPFGYVTMSIRQLQNLSSTATPAWEMPEIPFYDAIFTPFRTALAILAWGLFAFAFYRRLKHIEI